MAHEPITKMELPVVLLVDIANRSDPPYADIRWTGLTLDRVEGLQQAVGALSSRPYVMVLVVSDSGGEVVRIINRLKKEFPSIPVLAQTPELDASAVIDVFRAGAFDYLLEPVPAKKIEQLVNKVLERRTLGAHRQRLASQLLSERRKVEALKEKITKADPFEQIIGSSIATRRLVDTVREIARTDSTVLITGESGTGKGLVAGIVHAASDRRSGPFVTANCVVYSKHLLNSELFGHERGAFTGASRLKKGRFEIASGGTIFLDEIGEISQATQLMLLRILQERTFERVGGEATLEADVRLIAATNKDLHAAIGDGSFRPDLFYRLNVIPIHMPPLRDHPEDIPALAQHFLAGYTRRHGRFAEAFHPAVLDRMSEYGWPGNIRELENVVERMVVLCRSEEIGPDDLPPMLLGAERSRVRLARGTLEEIEAARITEALHEAGGNKKLAARRLGIHRSTLYKKIERLGLDCRRSEHGVSHEATRAANS